MVVSSAGLDWTPASAQGVADFLERHERRRVGQPARVAVVGGGVAGVSAARELIARGVAVVIIEDRSPDATVSVVAAGLVEPIAGTLEPAGQAVEMAAFARSMPVWRQLSAGGSALISRRRVLTVCAERRSPLPWANDVEDFRVVSTDAVHPDYSDGDAAEFYTYVVETPRWLMAARSRLAYVGVRFIRRHLTDFDEVPSVVGPVDAIVNAAGLAAGELAEDPTVFRGDGHVIRVAPVPGVSDVFMDETRMVEDSDEPNMLYVIPRRYDIVIGGTLWNSFDLTQSPELRSGMPERLLRLAVRVDPRLRSARVLDYQVGSRPRRRDGVRVELDLSRSVPIVHCYGQGGSGWTLAPGLAEATADLLVGAVRARRAG